MSDADRPSNGAKGGNGGHPAHGLPARNMADIARLFLEGARPMPVRTPPARRNRPDEPANKSAPEPAPQAPTTPDIHATTVLGLAAGGHDAATWKLLVRAAQGLAQEQSTAVALVGLLPNGVKTTLVIDVVGVESMEELPPVRTAGEAGVGAPDVQIARALHRLRPAVGLWIIGAPACAARAFPAISSIVREWLLACPTDDDGLVAGYQQLKLAWTRSGAGKDNRITPTVYLLSEDYAQAAVVHKRLRQAAQEFLGTDLALAGAGPIGRAAGAPAAHEPIRVFSIAFNGPEDALWAAVLDELCPMTNGDESFAPTEIETALDHVENQAAQVAQHSSATAAAALDHLAQVLDPDERAALAADFEEPGVPVATPPARRGRREVPPPVEAATPTPIFREPAPDDAFDAPDSGRPVPEIERPIPKDEPVARRAVPPSAPRPVPAPLPAAAPAIENRKSKIENPPPTLRAFDLESRLDRPAQWQAVEKSIWDLAPRSALLDARPPMAWASETCLTIDAQGRVNVWTLYKDGASWFALREWAHEHRNLLALTRRDLVVDKNAEVAVHIVLPLEEGENEGGDSQESVVTMLMRAPSPNLRLYRLRIVQWNARQGMLVVPIS